MELIDIIEAYNEIRFETNESAIGHYIIHRAITPNKSFGAYKEFKITLYFHDCGQNQVVKEIKDTYKASSTDEIRSCWIVLEQKAIKELIKWFLDGGK